MLLSKKKKNLTTFLLYQLVQIILSRGKANNGRGGKANNGRAVVGLSNPTFMLIDGVHPIRKDLETRCTSQLSEKSK